MNSLSLHLSKQFKRYAFSASALFIVLGLGTTAQAQSHAGHDHSEEAEHGESHEKHAEHDDEKKEAAGHDDHGKENKASGEEHGDEHGDEHGGPIELSSRDMSDFGIEVKVAEPGEIHDELRLQGEVSMNENAMGHVSPRFDGVVTSIKKRLGDSVKKGDVLASLESNDTLRPFDLKAPLDGTIVAFHITPGESLASGEVAYTVADTSTVWVDLRVYQRDLPKVHAKQTVRISAGHEYGETEGEISYVGPMIDETSRTGFARVVLPNPDGAYRPGLFVIGNVLLDAYRLPIVVPRSGVISMDGENIIFVESEDGHGYEKREVTLDKSDTKSVAIRSGLNRGERYVSKGGFFLKADSQKEDFGDGHGH
jgi:cobalt-zinc-cadmium efflux system membrane fusion protein